MALAQSDAGATAIFVDELDAPSFKRLPHDNERRPSGCLLTRLYLPHGHDADSGLIRQILLAPVQEPARRPALALVSQLTSFGPYSQYFIRYVEKRLTYH